jgi:predicted acetyltransferase
VPSDLVPGTFLVADVDGKLVGRVSVRHRLNGFLANFGGHIGYAVRPRYRGRGYAGEILCQSLIVARAEGVERALLTCDDENVASIVVIERHGGVLEDVRIDPDGVPRRRYWIS